MIYNHFPDKKIKIEEIDYESRRFFTITTAKNRSIKDFYSKITDLILDLILNIYSKDILNRHINTNFKNLQSIEKKELYDISKELLLSKDNFLVEKEYINNQIRKYVIDKPFISIDGFTIFRLREFNIFIDLVVDKGIEEFAAQKEYREFIKILKYFIDVQKSKYSLVNLIFENDDYRLFDDENNEIDKNFFEDIVSEIDDIGISEDDLLISSLIVLAPEKLTIHLNHKRKESEVIKIIADVFEDKVYFCLGCERCKGKLKVKNEK